MTDDLTTLREALLSRLLSLGDLSDRETTDLEREAKALNVLIKALRDAQSLLAEREAGALQARIFTEEERLAFLRKLKAMVDGGLFEPLSNNNEPDVFRD